MMKKLLLLVLFVGIAASSQAQSKVQKEENKLYSKDFCIKSVLFKKDEKGKEGSAEKKLEEKKPAEKK